MVARPWAGPEHHVLDLIALRMMFIGQKPQANRIYVIDGVLENGYFDWSTFWEC